MITQDLGAVTAYAIAVEGGYTGTEEEFEALLGNIAEDLSEIENLSVSVSTLPAGSQATASYNNGVISLGIPKGDKGDQGVKGDTGEAGFSPTATVTESGGDYEIDITDQSGTTTASFKAIKSIGNGLVLSSDGNLHIGTVESWEDVQKFVRAGQAKNVLQVGQRLSFTRDGQEIEATVMDFIEGGSHGGIHLKNGRQYGVIFQTEDILYNLQFDEKEAFYCAVDGLSAGSYSFVLGQHSWVSADVGKTFYFTLANDVPSGGQLVFAQAYNVTLEGATINVFASATDRTIFQTATMSSTEIAGATNLGTLMNSFNNGFNSCQRALLGNNNWEESAIRQQLNSDAVAGSVWSPQNIFDRPPNWVTNTKGFMNGLANNFLPYVSEVTVDTYRNTVCDGGGYDTTDEMFFFAGRKEVYMPSESNDDNNEPWAYYVEKTGFSTPSTSATDGRVKNNSNGSPYYWWLRSPHVGYAYGVRYVYASGASDGSYAYSSFGVVPAFVIA